MKPAQPVGKQISLTGRWIPTTGTSQPTMHEETEMIDDANENVDRGPKSLVNWLTRPNLRSSCTSSLVTAVAPDDRRLLLPKLEWRTE